MKDNEKYINASGERRRRVKMSPPYDGSREEEYTLQTLKVASEKPANRRKIHLWLSKGQREIDRLKAAGK